MTGLIENTKKKIGERHTPHKINPFMESGKITTRGRTRYLRNQSGNMMLVNADTGAIDYNFTGVATRELVDNTKFVKLYVNGVKAVTGLKNAGVKVFELLYRTMQDAMNRDQVYMSFIAINQDETPMSEATYMRGMRELIEKKFIAASHLPSMFWVNPFFMWNGDRLAYVQEYYKAGSPAGEAFRKKLREEELQERQKALPFDESEQPAIETADRYYEYSPELEAQDPFFDRATQAELVRRARNMDAGINCIEHEIIETD